MNFTKAPILAESYDVLQPGSEVLVKRLSTDCAAKNAALERIERIRTLINRPPALSFATIPLGGPKSADSFCPTPFRAPKSAKSVLSEAA